MDHGRKVHKMDLALTCKKPKLPFITVIDSPFVRDKPVVEDHRLVNWKRWLKRHHKQYQALEKGRPQCKTEMVMKSSERIRPQIEMKNLMEYATIPISSVPGNNQGNPGFWKVPPFLSSRGNSCSPEVGPVLTKKELNLLPELEYVDIPMCIREEKNVLNQLKKVPAWQDSLYLKKRKQELADALALLQPCAPEVENLMARGQGFGHTVENVIHLPVISITDTSLINEDSEIKIRESPVSSDVVVTLKVNDLEITRDEESINESSELDSKEITWTLNFSNKINQKSEQCLHFENTGTVAITYHWRNNISKSDIPALSSRGDASFFFNKNKALILPGQKMKFPVWFQKRRAGISSESWRLETDPMISRAVFIIRMRGFAESDDFYMSQLQVNVHLDRCIRNTAIRETINDIIRNIKPSRHPEPAYKSLYLEGTLFRTKNASHFYHPSLLAQFYSLYATTSAPGNSSWTLSLVDLHHRLLDIKNPELRRSKLQMFTDLCQKCLTELSSASQVQNTKYTMVYNVLCAFANKMEEESEFVKRNCILCRDKDVLDSCGVTSLNDSMTSIPKNIHTSDSSKTSHNSSLDIFDAKKRTEMALYREVFYVRIYHLLVVAVEEVCAVIDSLNSLDPQE